jgi:hypothetical protein
MNSILWSCQQPEKQLLISNYKKVTEENIPFILRMGWDWVPGYLGLKWFNSPDDKWKNWSVWWNVYWQGKPRYSEKNCFRATFPLHMNWHVATVKNYLSEICDWPTGWLSNKQTSKRTNELTNFMKLCLRYKFRVSQRERKIKHLWKPTFQYYVQTTLPLDATLSQLNPSLLLRNFSDLDSSGRCPMRWYLKACRLQMVKAKAISVTDREGPEGCETSRLPHFLDNRLTDGGEVSPTRRPPFTPRMIPGTHLC